eukprot:COSAG01_NODE_1924_length_8886_cov_6.780699_4_plen_229_part_00
MVRLHQKVNSERWYYWADKLGVMIYQDAPQHFGGNPSLELFTDDLTKMIDGRFSHPSILQWDIFNEGDCIREFMSANPKTPSNLVDLVRKIDPSRLVDVNSGGPGNGHGWGDVNDIHDYPQPRDPKPTGAQYAMVGEYGGIGAFITQWQPGKCHTYLKAATAKDEADIYVNMTKSLLANKDDISASVYTQITDVELECDGFLTYERHYKFSAEDTHRIFEANQALIKG